MKNRKRSGAVAVAAIAASVAMMFGASAPASASDVKDTLYHLMPSGTVYCPSWMTGRVSFKTAGYGDVSWTGSDTKFYRSTTTHYVYAKWGGQSSYGIASTDYVYDVYATCV